MESGWTQELLNWISANPGWAGLCVFLVSFVESLVIVGILVPGIIILFGIGALIGFGVADVWPIWLGGTLGAFLGDFLSFLVGHHYQRRLREFWPFSRYPRLLMRGTEYFRRHGFKSVLIGRFIGPLRPVVPASAGMLGMPLRGFLAVCIPACILWTPAYLVPGMLFGASLEVASEYAGRLALVVALGVGFVWLSLWFIRVVYEISLVNSARWLRRAIRWSRRHPVLGRITGPILDPAQPEVLSVTMLGLLLVPAGCAIVLLLFLAPFGAEPGVRDLAVMERMETLRNALTDPLLVAMSQLSRWWVLLPTAAVMLLWLLGARRRVAAMHWLVAMAGGALLHGLLSWTLRSMPILREAQVEQVYLPSAPTTMATVVLGFFSVLVAKELRRRHRRWPYVVATVLLSLLVFSRLYLGLDWLSGALLGLVLGFAWTVIVGMAYRTRAVRPFNGTVASGVFYGTLALSFAWQAAVHTAQDLEALQIPLPERTVAAETWWQTGWDELPAERTVSRSEAARTFNLQLAGPLEPLREELLARGWEPAGPPAGWRWILHSLNPEASEDSLPLTGKNFRGYGEVLVMRRPGGDAGRQRVLRLWDSGTRLAPVGRTVYLGQFYEETLAQRLRLFSYWRAAPLAEGELAGFGNGLRGFDARLPRDGLLIIRPLDPPGSEAGPPAMTAGVAGDRSFPAVPASPPLPAATAR